MPSPARHLPHGAALGICTCTGALVLTMRSLPILTAIQPSSLLDVRTCRQVMPFASGPTSGPMAVSLRSRRHDDDDLRGAVLFLAQIQAITRGDEEFLRRLRRAADLCAAVRALRRCQMRR